MQRFTKLWNLVVGACAEVFFLAEACIFLTERSGFTGCRVDIGCVTETIRQLLLLYVGQVLGKESDVDGPHQAHSAAEGRVRAVEAIEAQNSLYMREVSEGLSSM